MIFDSVTLELRALISGSKIQILHKMQMNNIGSILNAFQEHVARSLLITIHFNSGWDIGIFIELDVAAAATAIN